MHGIIEFILIDSFGQVPWLAYSMYSRRKLTVYTSFIADFKVEKCTMRTASILNRIAFIIGKTINAVVGKFDSLGSKELSQVLRKSN